MTDDLEDRLAARFGGLLPGAPGSLLEALERVPHTHPRTGSSRGSRGAVAMRAAGVALAVGLFWFFLPRQGPATPADASPSPSLAAPDPSPATLSSPSPSPDAVGVGAWTVAEFIARRDAKCSRLRRRRAGHDVFSQRQTTSSSGFVSRLSQNGHVVGITHGDESAGRLSRTGPMTLGMTSPPFSMMTVSPSRTSRRATSCSLCSVAIVIVDPLR